MSSPSTYLNPALGRLPGCVSPALVSDLLRCLPRPRPGGPAAYGRQLIEDALAAIDAAGPRDRWEAELVVQMVALRIQARGVLALAAAAEDPAQMVRWQKHHAALGRRVDALGRELRRHRRELAAEDVRHVSPPGLVCDVEALEAAWRDLEAALPETALVAAPLEIPAGCFGVAAAGSDAGLEARDEFEAAPLPAFQGVPKWKQAGRKFLDELTEEEFAELIAVQLRGETIEEPPQRVEAYIEP